MAAENRFMGLSQVFNEIFMKLHLVVNALPFEVRDSKSLDIFKSKLKTHLFRLAFLL